MFLNLTTDMAGHINKMRTLFDDKRALIVEEEIQRTAEKAQKVTGPFGEADSA